MIDNVYYLHHAVALDDTVRIGPFSVIGAGAFWFPRDAEDRFVPKEHETKGGVIIQHHVTILSLTTIERAIEVGQNTIIRAHTKIDNNVLIGHDCDIGEGNRITAGAVIGGRVRTGRNVFVGLNATIKPKVVIGDGALIGAGAVVICDVPPFEVWAGNPARKIKDDDYFIKPNRDQILCPRCNSKMIERMNELGETILQCIYCYRETEVSK